MTKWSKALHWWDQINENEKILATPPGLGKLQKRISSIKGFEWERFRHFHSIRKNATLGTSATDPWTASPPWARTRLTREVTPGPSSSPVAPTANTTSSWSTGSRTFQCACPAVSWPTSYKVYLAMVVAAEHTPHFWGHGFEPHRVLGIFSSFLSHIVIY